MSDARWTRSFWLLISVWNQAILLWVTLALQSWASAVTVIKCKNCTKINVDQERFQGLQGRATAQNVKNEVKIQLTLFSLLFYKLGQALQLILFFFLFFFQLTLEQRGGWGADPSHSQKSAYNFIISPSYPHGSTFAVSINSGPTVMLLFTPEKAPHVSGLTQFKPALPKDLSVCHLFQQITNPFEHKSCAVLNCVWLFATPWTACSLPGSSVHGNFQARILEWLVISSSRGPSWPRDQTHISCIGRQILYQSKSLAERFEHEY